MISVFNTCASANSVNNDRARVYILAGQSNSNGEGLVSVLSDLPTNLQSQFDNVFIIDRHTSGVDNLQYLVNNKDDTNQGASVRTNAIGQELELGRLLNQYYGHDIYFNKVATGGVGVHAGQVWYWVDGSYHTRLEGQHDQLLSHLQSNNIDYDIDALIWVQGEDSSNSSLTANAYFDDALACFTRIRTYVGKPNLPVIQVRLRTDIPRTYPSITRGKQELLASTYPATIFYVNADDTVMIDNGIHYDMNSQITLSNRIFNILTTL